MAKVIDMFICGAQKSGTSSLLEYIKQHPNVIKQNLNELPFLVDEQIYSLGYEHTYKTYFEPAKNQERVVVAKNVGVMNYPISIERLYHHNPNCFVVLILRNPVDRAYSNYYYALRKGDETIQNFDQAIAAEPLRLSQDKFKWRHCSYLDRGIYYKQIEEFLKYFPKKQLLIFTFESFKNKPDDVVNTLFEKLDISINSKKIETKIKHNEKAMSKSLFLSKLIKSNGIFKKLAKKILSKNFGRSFKKRILKLNETSFDQPKMDNATREKLIEYFEPHNKKLSEITGINFDYWNK